MGRYDNYSNSKNIEKIQSKLNALRKKRKPNQFEIESWQRKLDTAKLFESCQIFHSFNGRAPNTRILFSDDNRVLQFGNKLIQYDDIESYQIIESTVSKSYTTTQQKGTISRAIVGGAIAGSVGAVVGAMSAGSKSDTTYYSKGDGFLFQIFMKDGNGFQMLPFILNVHNGARRAIHHLPDGLLRHALCNPRTLQRQPKRFQIQSASIFVHLFITLSHCTFRAW